jgi:tRNA (guanosine-2'-O-)-methyltransferase
MTEQRKKRFLSVLSHRQPTLTLVMEDIHDPHNVSAMLRSADAVGVMEINLLYTQDKFPKLGKKSSASANKWITRQSFRTVKECYAALHDKGFLICATHLGRRSKSLYKLDLTKKVALVFGNEHRGVSDEAAELADINFQIPMMGMIQSLNVSVACAVSLYEALRQRKEAGLYDEPALSQAAIRKVFKEWQKR